MKSPGKMYASYITKASTLRKIFNIERDSKEEKQIANLIVKGCFPIVAVLKVRKITFDDLGIFL